MQRGFRIIRKETIWLILIILLILPTVVALFKPGLFLTQDGDNLLIRSAQFHIALRDGQIPPRWAPTLNQGYGYPILMFYYPGVYIATEVFHLVGFSLINSFKIVMGVTFIGSASVMYFWQLSLWKSRIAALTAAVLYCIAPYRFLDIYVRGSVSEALVFVFLPIMFLSLRLNSPLFMVVGGIAIAGAIISHNVVGFLSLVMFVGFAFIFYLLEKKKKSFTNLVATIVLGLLISAFFWLPAFIEKSFTQLGQVKISDFSEHFLIISQIIYSQKGLGVSVSGANDAMGLQLGFAFWLVLGSAFVFIKKIRNENKIKKYYFIFFLGLLTASIIFTTELSSYIWQFIPLKDYIQFPWRLLFFATFAGAALSGLIVSLLNNKTIQIIFSTVLILIALLELPLYFAISRERKMEDSFYFTNPSTTLNKNELNPLWVKKQPESYSFEKLEKSESLDILNSNIKSNHYYFDVDVKNESQVTINTLDFPGWTVEVNGRKIMTTHDNQYGLIQFPLPKGMSTIEVRFEETQIRKIANLLTLIGFVGAGLILFRKKWLI